MKRSSFRSRSLAPQQGLRPADEGNEKYQWIRSRKHFFLPVKVLSRYFPYNFLKALKTAHEKGELNTSITATVGDRQP